MKSVLSRPNKPRLSLRLAKNFRFTLHPEIQNHLGHIPFEPKVPSWIVKDIARLQAHMLEQRICISVGKLRSPSKPTVFEYFGGFAAVAILRELEALPVGLKDKLKVPIANYPGISPDRIRTIAGSELLCLSTFHKASITDIKALYQGQPPSPKVLPEPDAFGNSLSKGEG